MHFPNWIFAVGNPNFLPIRSPVWTLPITEWQEPSKSFAVSTSPVFIRSRILDDDIFKFLFFFISKISTFIPKVFPNLFSVSAFPDRALPNLKS